MVVIPVSEAPAPGPHDPCRTTPPRLPGSIRRTSSIDTSRPRGRGGTLVVDARARDTTTKPDGSVATVGARFRLTLDDATRTIREAAAEPAVPGLEALVGTAVGPGFRQAVADALPDEHARRSLLHLLLDDLPGASLVSGFALVRDEPVPHRPDGRMRPDLCAGWQAEGGMMRAAAATGFVPVPTGPPAPILEADDPLSWHAMDPLPVHGMRRRRRLDLRPTGDDDRYEFDVHFRDSHLDETEETVLHEYTLTGVLEAGSRELTELEGRARVLPWQECPGALVSIDAVRGAALDALPALVRRDLRGATSCTHLNDTLRSLGDLAALLDRLQHRRTDDG